MRIYTYVEIQVCRYFSQTNTGLGLHKIKTQTMKYLKLLPLLVLSIGLISLFGCTKKKDNSTSGTGKPFYVKLDGVAFEPAGGGRYFDISAAGGGGIQIVGDDANTTIELRLTAATVGTYSLGASGAGNNSASVYYTSGGKVYISTTGQVKITKVDGDKITGTFSYTAVGSAGTVAVTEGEFNNIPKK